MERKRVISSASPRMSSKLPSCYKQVEMAASARMNKLAFLSCFHQDQFPETVPVQTAGEEQDHIFKHQSTLRLQFSVALTCYIHCKLFPVQSRREDCIFQNESLQNMSQFKGFCTKHTSTTMKFFGLCAAD